MIMTAAFDKELMRKLYEREELVLRKKMCFGLTKSASLDVACPLNAL